MHNPQMAQVQSIVPIERIASTIYVIRGEKVMLDSDLADLYGVETGALVRAVKRNIRRFPEDFVFQLNDLEFENLKCQSGTSSQWGGRRTRPFAFTEQGVAMLSSVLRSDRAADVNFAIMRAFVKLRQLLATNTELSRKVEEHDRKIAILFDTLQKLLTTPASNKNPIGYIHPKD
jgi:hypothetical protein